MTLNMVHMHNDHILFHEKFLGPEIANISKKWYKSSSNFRTAQTINVKVESEVQQFQIVSDGPEDLEAEVLNQSEVSNLSAHQSIYLILLDGVEDAEHGGGGGAHHEEDDDGDQDDHQHPLLRAVQHLLPARSGAPSVRTQYVAVEWRNEMKI